MEFLAGFPIFRQTSPGQRRGRISWSQHPFPEDVCQHPLGNIAQNLAAYLGHPCDLITLTEWLSLLGGWMAMPINLDIITPDLTADLMIADRVLQLADENVQRVNQLGEIHDLEAADFCDTCAVLVRGGHRNLFRSATELTARTVSTDQDLPSIWRIDDQLPVRPGLGPTIRMLTANIERDFRGFAESYAMAPSSTSSHADALHMTAWPSRITIECPFRARLRCHIRPEEKLIVERLLALISAVRIHLNTGNFRPAGGRNLILARDQSPGRIIRCLRAVLVNLPVSGGRTRSSPRRRPRRPRCSTTESTTRATSVTCRMLTRGTTGGLRGTWPWSGPARSYNTVKDHLAQMEAEGLVQGDHGPERQGEGQANPFPVPRRRAAALHPEKPVRRLAGALCSGLQFCAAIVTSCLPWFLRDYTPVCS